MKWEIRKQLQGYKLEVEEPGDVLMMVQLAKKVDPGKSNFVAQSEKITITIANSDLLYDDKERFTIQKVVQTDRTQPDYGVPFLNVEITTLFGTNSQGDDGGPALEPRDRRANIMWSKLYDDRVQLNQLFTPIEEEAGASRLEILRIQETRGYRMDRPMVRVLMGETRKEALRFLATYIGRKKNIRRLEAVIKIFTDPTKCLCRFRDPTRCTCGARARQEDQILNGEGRVVAVRAVTLEYPNGFPDATKQIIRRTLRTLRFQSDRRKENQESTKKRQLSSENSLR